MCKNAVHKITMNGDIHKLDRVKLNRATKFSKTKTFGQYRKYAQFSWEVYKQNALLFKYLAFSLWLSLTTLCALDSAPAVWSVLN